MIIALDDEKIDTETLLNEIRCLNESVKLINESRFVNLRISGGWKSEREVKIKFHREHNILEKRDNLKTRLDDLNKWASKQDKLFQEMTAIAVINKKFNLQRI